MWRYLAVVGHPLLQACLEYLVALLEIGTPLVGAVGSRDRDAAAREAVWTLVNTICQHILQLDGRLAPGGSAPGLRDVCFRKRQESTHVPEGPRSQ